MTRNIVIALAEGFEEMEAVIPIDVLRRAGCTVSTVALADRTVVGAHGIMIAADKIWSEAADDTPDLLVLPGGMPGSKNLGEHAGLRAMAERVAAAGGVLGAICAAPAFTLAAWGLLTGRRATCYPGCEEQFPDDATYDDDAVVVDGPIVTGKGPGAALEFALTLVRKVVDAEKAETVKTQMQCIL